MIVSTSPISMVASWAPAIGSPSWVRRRSSPRQSLAMTMGEGDDMEVVDLKEDGRDVDVTEENKEE